MYFNILKESLKVFDFKTLFQHDFVDRPEEFATIFPNTTSGGSESSICELLVDLLILCINTDELREVQKVDVSTHQ
jgi:hypothetical protein